MRRKFAVRTGAGLAALLIVVNALLLVLFFNSIGADEQALAAESGAHESALQQVIRRYEPYVELSREGDRPTISGYVDTEQDRDELIRASLQVNPDITIHVRSTQSLLLSVRRQLQEDGWGSQLNAVAREPGVVRIHGALSTEIAQVHQRWQKTEQRIRQDIPLKQLSVEFDQPAENVLSRSRSDGALRTPVPQPGLKTEIHGNSLPILDVRVSHDKVFTLLNGRQVSIGGRLSDGSRVVEIDLDHAVVRTISGKSVIVPYGIGG